MKVIFATPSVSGPTKPYLRSLKASIPLIKKAGWKEGYVQEIGNPYISSARAILTRRALDANPDYIVFLDYDLSWKPNDLLTLLNTAGDVVAGTYRFKQEEENYMGAVLSGQDGTPIVYEDGTLAADRVPAGFLKISVKAIEKFMKSYPHLMFGPRRSPSIDLFNHGAHEGVWYGEDYAFSRNWVDCGGKIFIVPNLDIAHHSLDKVYKGNFHKFLMKQTKPAKKG